MGLLISIVRGVDRLAVFLAVLGALSLGGAALATAADVAIRPFGLGIRGVVDIVQLCVITGIFLGMPYTFFSEGHVRVELLLDAVPSPVRRALLVVVDVAAIAFLVVLSIKTVEGLQSAIARNDISLNLALPMAWFWGPMALGLGLSIVTSAALVLKRWLPRQDDHREDVSASLKRQPDA